MKQSQAPDTAGQISAVAPASVVSDAAAQPTAPVAKPQGASHDPAPATDADALGADHGEKGEKAEKGEKIRRSRFPGRNMRSKKVAESAPDAGAPIKAKRAPKAAAPELLTPNQDIDQATEPGLAEGDAAQFNPALDGVQTMDAAPTRRPARERKAPASQAAQAKDGKNDNAYSFDDVISGAFDADTVAAPESDASAEHVNSKRVLKPEPEVPKLHKVLAQSGLGSRLEMEQLILEGRISVNGEPAHIGQRIQFGDQVKVNGKPLRLRITPPPTRVLAYHKPVGEVVTHDDPQNRPTVFRKLPKLQTGKWQSVGRLDLNTEGLLLFCNSGELANKLTHPSFGLEREYAVRVLGALSSEKKQRLLAGIKLEDGMAQFGSIEDGGGEGANCWYRVTISEGRNREVRRMFEALGHAVSRLIRIRYGAMVLPKGLRRGFWMELDESDIHSLGMAAGSSDRFPAKNARGAGQAKGGQAKSGAGQNHYAGAKKAGTGAAGGAGAGRGKNPNGFKHKNSSQGAANGQSGQGGKSRGGEGGGNGGGHGGGNGGSNGGQPDPMKTSFGYIGADSFQRQRSNGGRTGGGGQRPGMGGGRMGGGRGGGQGGGQGGGNRSGGRSR